MSPPPISPIAPRPELGNQQGFVMLPYTKEQFRDFIKELLGTPQTIVKEIYGTFEINADDLGNLHQLVTQRVQQQNDGCLIQFKAVIVYSDQSSVELASPEELVTYNQIRPIISEAVHLDWTFMVKFRDKDKLEKQRIQISIVASGTNPIPLRHPELLGARTIILNKRSGAFSISIEHTARTWGADVEAMLTHHIQTLCRQEHSIPKFLRKHSGWIGLAIGGLLFLSICFGLYCALSSYTATQGVELDRIVNTADPEVRANKLLEYIGRFVVSGAWPKQTLFQVISVILGFIVSLVVATWSSSTADNSPPSFVLLTRSSLKNKEDVLRGRKNTFISFVCSVAFALATGIGGNILFERYFK